MGHGVQPCQVIPREQKAQCQHHSPHFVPSPICCPYWDMFGGRTLVPPGPPVSLQELQGGAGTWCDVGTQVPGLMTPSSCREGLGSGRWPEGREGATGLGGAAADSLFSGTLSQAYTTSSAAPQPRHGSPSGWQGAPANSPSLAAPTARQGAGREQGALMAGLCSP